MKDLLRTTMAAVIGAVVAVVVVVGQPALAGQVNKGAAKNSVTSKSIKNGTIKTKDLGAEVTGPLAKAGTALQAVPDNSVTTSKLANGAVTNPKLADNAVTGAKVADNSLRLADIATATGTINIDFPSMALHGCFAQVNISTGTVVTGDILQVSQPANVVGAITIQIRENASDPGRIDIVACNVAAPSAVDPPSATYRWSVISVN